MDYKKILNKIKDIIIRVIKRIDYFFVEQIYFFNRLSKKKLEYDEKNVMVLIYKLNNGGAEKVAADISDRIMKKYNLILVTCDDIAENDYKCNAKRIVLNTKNAILLRNLNIVKQLIKIKKQYNITHTISFGSKINFYNTMSKINDKTIISIGNYLSKSEKEIRLKHINRMSAKYSDKIVVVSKMMIDDLVNNFNADINKITAIYNFCDGEKIDEKLKENINIEKENNTVINIGRLSYQKGQINLIKAFKMVTTEIPDAKLIILGQGNLKEDLESEIKNLKLENNVFLKGFQKNPYSYLKKADVFVLSSFYEGMSNVILEAMYVGLPVISTDCQTGTREIIAPNTNLYKENTCITNEEYGILVPVIRSEKDEEFMSKAIIDILKDNKLKDYYSKKSKERIKCFSKDESIKHWLEIIEKI